MANFIAGCSCGGCRNTRVPRDTPQATGELDIADVLERAAGILKRDGWCKGSYHATTGDHCAIGAIEVAINPLYNRPGGFHANEVYGKSDLQKVMQVQKVFLAYSQPKIDGGDFVESIPHWNDGMAKDGEEVIKTLECVAKTLKEDLQQSPSAVTDAVESWEQEKKAYADRKLKEQEERLKAAIERHGGIVREQALRRAEERRLMDQFPYDQPIFLTDGPTWQEEIFAVDIPWGLKDEK